MKTVVFVSPKHFFLSGLCLRHLINVNGVRDIIVITPNVEKLREFHTWLKLSNISYLSDYYVCSKIEVDSLNFLSKQYAVLNLDRIVDGDNIFNVDSDVIFNKSVDLSYKNKTIFYMENEFSECFFETIYDMFGYEKVLDDSNSFIADFMLLNSKNLFQMRSECVYLNDYKKFNKLVEKNTPKTVPKSYPAFSEYETYGTWMMYNQLDKMKLINSYTFDNNVKFQFFQPTVDNLNNTPRIITLRQTWDTDINWNNIYDKDWINFK